MKLVLQDLVLQNVTFSSFDMIAQLMLTPVLVLDYWNGFE